MRGQPADTNGESKMPPRRPLLSLLLLVALCPTAGHAWRETGHFAVCEIAYRHLSPEARREIDSLLEGRDFATQCTWPDMVRKSEAWGFTYNWHFINLDNGQAYFNERTIHRDGDVLQALLLAEAKLKSTETSREEKRVYLRFLSHFSGDSHQPLHVGTKADLGGNQIEVTWFGEPTFESVEIVLAGVEACGQNGSYVDEATGECVRRSVSHPKVNLHKVWDLLMIQRFIAENHLEAEDGDSQFLHKAYASTVEGMLAPEEITEVAGSSFWSWVAESLALRTAAYETGDGELAGKYYRRNIGMLNRRVALAGYRLAATLNRLFGGEANPELERTHNELRRRIVELAGGESPLVKLWP